MKDEVNLQNQNNLLQKTEGCDFFFEKFSAF